MSRTGTEDATLFAATGRDRFLESNVVPLFRPDPQWTMTVGECDHTNLNHNKTRCLDCGLLAEEAISLPRGLA